ncbi:MAG: Hpt domain-containing protein [Hyphomicrobiales bacterium]|nr:Hpt domain-containing protein [Hyphomicrobiales bacterium]
MSAIARCRASSPAARADTADEPAIDLVHLARQTDNDRALEDELLALFDRQSASLLAQLSHAGAAVRARVDAAHTLRGSALALGAGAVARAALALETALQAGGADEGELETLALAVEQARAAIARLRG